LAKPAYSNLADVAQDHGFKYAELKLQLDEVKQQLEIAMVDIWQLKMENQERKKAIVLDTPLLVTLFVGVIVGVLVTVKWTWTSVSSLCKGCLVCWVSWSVHEH